MKINYNATGVIRKELVQVIGQALGITPVYKRMPTCEYEIGSITVNRDGEMVWDDRTDEETLQTVKAAIAAAGFEPAAEIEEPTDADPEPVELTVTIPTSHHTGSSLRNLVNLLYTRASLLNKALGTDFSVTEGLVEALAENENLHTTEDFCRVIEAYESEHGPAISGLNITQENLSFTTLPETDDPERVKTFTELAAMMNKQALSQKRIQAKAVNEENEKYALRVWLTRLGMNGPEYKASRKILMENLSGHSAFRTEEEKQRWTQRQAEKREAAKARKEAENG